ncbi:MAG TPA: copper resistance protein B [Allosphingosinicella sp.]|nr:copper resistance protein B [Allosphingosinicella sp.]
MKRLLILLAATALTAPALAQHGGHHPPGHTMPMPKTKPKAAPAKPPVKAKRGAKKAAPKFVRKPPAKKAPSKPVAGKPAPKAAQRKAAPKPAADPHAGHNMPATPPAHSAPPAGADPHAGHSAPQAPVSAADPHAGHDMSGMDKAHPIPPTAPPPAAAFSGPAHAADLVFNPAVMAQAREELREEHGSMKTYKVLVDQLEAKLRNGRDGYAWDAQAWYGGDAVKLWLKTEGEGALGDAIEDAEVQALWSRAIDPWFDLQLGVRHDFRPDPERTHLVVGVQGLAPYWFEVDAAAFVSNKGDVTARLEAEYDLRITQKLILQPRVELDLSFQDVPEIGIGSGLSSGEIGARLRYEIRPEFAPYVGVEYERAFGRTADLRRATGEKAGGLSLLVGLRTWF